MAGYSGTPLPQKLGIKPGARVAVFAAPAGFNRTLGALPEGARIEDGSSKSGAFDVGIFFTRSAAELERRMPRLKKRLEPSGGLWIAWPKKASGEKTDMTEDVARRIALANALVDNKVCAIDEIWSGLRIVYRVADRPAKQKAAKKKAAERKRA